MDGPYTVIVNHEPSNAIVKDRVRLAELHAASKFHLRATAVMVFIIYWVMIFTYKDFFLFNPMNASSFGREFVLWLCLIGWLLASTASPIVIWLASNGNMTAFRLGPIFALWWPISILISQMTLLISTGENYFGYLWEYPVFVITDIALPVLVTWKWLRVYFAIRAESGSEHLFV